MRQVRIEPMRITGEKDQCANHCPIEAQLSHMILFLNRIFITGSIFPPTTSVRHT